MNDVRFLCDENTAPALIAAMKQLVATIDIMRVGDPGAPPRGTTDPDLLIACAALGRVLITRDRQSMPRHLVNHFAAGHHTAGVILLRRGLTYGQYAGEIVNRWTNTIADD
jgi:hypothetical protein